MNLFTRQATLAREHVQEGLAYAVDIASYVSEKSGLAVIPWATVYGAPVGSVSWSTRAESQAAMGAAQDKLAADAGFQQRVKDHTHLFDGAVEDNIGQFVAFSGAGETIREYAAVVTAQCAPGKIAEGMAWGVDIMHYVSKLTGLDTSLVRGIYGPWATLVWISLADDLEAADAADAAMSSDPTYLERLDQGGELFLPGTVSQRLIRRLA